MDTCILDTPLGFAKIVGDSEGVSEVSILNSEAQESQNIPESLNNCVQQLQEYFRSERQEFDLKLNPKGSDFQKTVWEALLNIPFGRTRSYMELSKELGDPKAIRAVANANGKNPIWIIIPCHRIIGSDGSLTGYAGGLQRKQWLLEHENHIKQQRLF